MIRYRIPHEWELERDFCRWCGASMEAIEDGRKPRYCRKNLKFRAPGYLNAEALEQICIEISKKTRGGLALNVTHMIVDVLGLAEDPGVGFYGWAFPDILAHAKAYEAAARDGMALQSVAHPLANPRLVDPDEWYLPESERSNVKTATQVHREQMAADLLNRAFTNVGKPKLSAEEHCKWLCAWKGGGPCLADDCPRRHQHENGDGV